MNCTTYTTSAETQIDEFSDSLLSDYLPIIAGGISVFLLVVVVASCIKIRRKGLFERNKSKQKPNEAVHDIPDDFYRETDNDNKTYYDRICDLRNIHGGTGNIYDHTNQTDDNYTKALFRKDVRHTGNLYDKTESYSDQKRSTSSDVIDDYEFCVVNLTDTDKKSIN